MTNTLEKIDNLMTLVSGNINYLEVDNPNDLQKTLDNNVNIKGNIYLLFFANIDNNTNKSWCPDCTQAKPIIDKVRNKKLTDNDLFIHVWVGDKITWKDKNHTYRLNNRLNITAVPTLYNYTNKTRLIEDHCFDINIVELFFTSNYNNFNNNNKFTINNDINKLNDILSKNKNKNIYLLFFANISKTSGLSWCPDCRAALPYINLAVHNNLNSNDVFIKIFVGDRDTWKNPKNIFRLDDRFTVKGVPTLMKYGTNQKLGDKECTNLNSLNSLFN